MYFLSSFLQQYPWTETFLYIFGPSAVIASAVLYLVMIVKNERIRKLQSSLKDLQKTYDELDNQAKLIIKTDLELHNTQGELDKKVTGLYTLQKISRMLSTTLDENEVFTKVSAEHLTELGFDKAMSFLVAPHNISSLSNSNVDIKLNVGYEAAEINLILDNQYAKNIFLFPLAKTEILSNLDQKIDKKTLEEFLKVCKIFSFVCAPIAVKEGVIGMLLVGSESKYSPITLGDKEIVSILAHQIGQSIENARLFEATWRSQHDLEMKVKQRTKELTEALEEIKIITKRKSDFVSAVSHELRTPLTSIKGYASLLSAGKLGEISAPVKERIEKINAHSDWLTQIINNLLDISRIESGRVEMKFENINLRNVLAAIEDIFTPHLKEKQITFKQEVAEGVNTVSADKSQFQRIFINLVGNALKFTPPQGIITIKAKATDGLIQIDVIDTGSGIAEQNISKLFEEFYREDNEINQSVKGTGLGLSLVKYIVEAHNGKIWVNSKLNQGTTFSFTVPAKRN